MDWLKRKILEYVIRNWKSTLVGVIGAILTQVPALAPYKEQIVAAVIALLGLVAKDGDKTGTVEQPRPKPVLPVIPPIAPAPSEPEVGTGG